MCQDVFGAAGSGERYRAKRSDPPLFPRRRRASPPARGGKEKSPRIGRTSPGPSPEAHESTRGGGVKKRLCSEGTGARSGLGFTTVGLAGMIPHRMGCRIGNSSGGHCPPDGRGPFAVGRTHPYVYSDLKRSDPWEEDAGS
jgi:hypothetical protein